MALHPRVETIILLLVDSAFLEDTLESFSHTPPTPRSPPQSRGHGLSRVLAMALRLAREALRLTLPRVLTLTRACPPKVCALDTRVRG
jgi:hypothetical protein